MREYLFDPRKLRLTIDLGHRLLELRGSKLYLSVLAMYSFRAAVQLSFRPVGLACWGGFFRLLSSDGRQFGFGVNDIFNPQIRRLPTSPVSDFFEE